MLKSGWVAAEKRRDREGARSNGRDIGALHTYIKCTAPMVLMTHSAHIIQTMHCASWMLTLMRQHAFNVSIAQLSSITDRL